VPDVLDVSKDIGGKSQHHLERPPAEKQCDRTDRQKLWDYGEGHIADGSNRLKQRYRYAHHQTGY